MTTTQGRRLPGLDGMRFVMCLGIAAFHFRGLLWSSGDGEFHYILHARYFTDIFFIISGFFIAEQWAASRGRSGHYLRFVFLRWIRIYPLYAVALAFFFVAAVNEEIELEFFRVLTNLLLVHEWVGVDVKAYNYVTWSLSALWFLYLLFPALFALAGRGWLLSIAIILSFILVGREATALGFTSGIWRGLPSFFFGIVLVRACPLQLKRWQIILGGSVGAIALFAPPYLHTGAGRQLLIYFFMYFILLADKSGVRTPLAWGGFRTLAQYSFGLYVLHPIIHVVFVNKMVASLGGRQALYASEYHALIGTAVFCTALLLSLALAVLAYHLLESPIYSYVRRLVNPMNYQDRAPTLKNSTKNCEGGKSMSPRLYE